MPLQKELALWEIYLCTFRKNSADAWSRPEVFRKGVHAGVPPDIYAEDGQDWGNPIYDWKVMAKDGYQWWKDRVQWLKEFCDLVRIDHIRGIYSYWAVPDGALPKDVKSLDSPALRLL